MVHLKAFPRQQDAQKTLAEPATLIRQLTQPLTRGLITLILLLVLKDRSMDVSQLTRPTFRQAVPVHNIRHGPALHVSGMALEPMAASYQTVSSFLSQDT